MEPVSLREMILEEHSKTQTDKIIAWVGIDQRRFDELVKLFLGDEYRVTQRAGWPLSYIAIAQPALAKKHLKKLVENLRQPNLHNAIKRNTLRFLQQTDITKSLQGELMDHCFRFIETVNEPVAIKAFSLTILHNLSKQFPEILPEIKAIIADQIDHQTAAFTSRAKVFL
jgi:hypothetical protein